MELIRNILDHKGYSIFTAAPDTPLREALREMAEHNVGSLLVFRGEQVVGILTERDYLRWTVAAKGDPATAQVAEVMDERLHRIRPEQRVDEAMKQMTEVRVRHLIVEDRGRAVGLVSIGDIVHAVIQAQASEIDHLHRYIQGEGPSQAL